MIHFSHIRNTPNTGDLMSCPADYFDFPAHRVVNYDAAEGGNAKTIIYGGGTMNNWLQGRPLVPNAQRIAWGIGSSRHGETEPWPDPEGFDLLGVREWTPEREAAGLWAPCASCMSPLFDHDYFVRHEAVLFLNASPSIRSRYPVAVGGLPVMENTEPLDRVIPFLASAKIVVTDSYHGIYFATLLGCRVVAVPYSSKFYSFRHPPAYSRNGGLDWRERSKDALLHLDALDVCRDASRAFYGRVMEVIGERRAA